MVVVGGTECGEVDVKDRGGGGQRIGSSCYASVLRLTFDIRCADSGRRHSTNNQSFFMLILCISLLSLHGAGHHAPPYEMCRRLRDRQE
jgi:hypothetical protein